MVTGDSEHGQQVWALMYRYVEAQNRRGELADALGFRLGGGRGKVLFGLREGPATLRDIAERHGVDAPYATVIVDKLEAHGLVERRPHPEDKRRKLVVLTAKGHDAIATADAVLHRSPPSIATLSDDERSQLSVLMTRLIEADAESSDGPT